MKKSPTFLERASLATGIELSEKYLELIFSIQDENQNNQFKEDLIMVVKIYENAAIHDGAATEQTKEDWKKASSRIAIWCSWANMAIPVRTSLFGKKRIHPTKKLFLSRLLSADCELVRSGKLDF